MRSNDCLTGFNLLNFASYFWAPQNVKGKATVCIGLTLHAPSGTLSSHLSDIRGLLGEL